MGRARSLAQLYVTLLASKLCFQKWGFEKGLWADEEKGTLEYQRKHVLEVSVVNDHLKIKYDSKWEQRFSHAEWTDIVASIRAKFQRGGDNGIGKGKAAPE